MKILKDPDIATIKSVLSKQLRTNIQNVQPLSTGANSYAYIINEQYIARFPRTTESLLKLQKETEILPIIKTFCSLTTPVVSFHDAEFAFTYHEMIPGTCLSYEDLSKFTQQQKRAFSQAVGKFIIETHNIPKSEFNHLGLPTWNRFDRMHKRKEHVYTSIKETDTLDASTKQHILQFIDNDLTPPPSD